MGLAISHAAPTAAKTEDIPTSHQTEALNGILQEVYKLTSSSLRHVNPLPRLQRKPDSEVRGHILKSWIWTALSFLLKGAMLWNFKLLGQL